MDLLTNLNPPLPIPIYALSLSLLFLLPITLLKLYTYTSLFPRRPTPTPSATLAPTVLSVSVSPTHAFTKHPTPSITLIPHLGVKGDAHLGATVQHRSRLHITPPPPNLRQVHLIQNEILQDFSVQPAEIGENVTTSGIDLLALNRGTKLRFIPPEAAENDADADDDRAEAKERAREPPTITITGLRNPCPQIEKYREGLQEKFIVRDGERKIIARKAGVMSTVDVGGEVRAGMRILVEEPEKFEALGCV